MAMSSAGAALARFGFFSFEGPNKEIATSRAGVGDAEQTSARGLIIAASKNYSDGALLRRRLGHNPN
jgi:hypothetical protein